ncbi:P-loop containing nucleoside triphosphate hydrolase protein [Acephala macrosclerotiorum]|nr:P-loop containing nucleoside triphosphate hydrolase protein [Acephala macrosclerotiorum]
MGPPRAAYHSIIFSGWTRTLDLIERHLTERSILFKRIDGSSSLPLRNKILNDFRKNSQIRILMMTTGTGAVGLNLAVASRVHIFEPQWNPMVESQAVARVVRLGQKKKVVIIRYIVEGTVEQNMRSQQQRKLALADVGWSNTAVCKE